MNSNVERVKLLPEGMKLVKHWNFTYMMGLSLFCSFFEKQQRKLGQAHLGYVQTQKVLFLWVLDLWTMKGQVCPEFCRVSTILRMTEWKLSHHGHFSWFAQVMSVTSMCAVSCSSYFTDEEPGIREELWLAQAPGLAHGMAGGEPRFWSLSNS